MYFTVKFKRINRINKIFLSVSLLIFLPKIFFGQDYRSTNISLPEGLSQSTVYSIGQDKTGFLWIGTQDGLNVYDGLNFKTFYNHPFDTNSISSANIMTILHDSKGRTWIGTANAGLNLKTSFDDKFIRFSTALNSGLKSNSIITLFEDSKGNIFAGTSDDIYKIQESGEGKKQSDFKFEGLKNEADKYSFEYIHAISEAGNKKYWMCNMKELFLMEYHKDASRIIKKFSADDGLAKGNLLALTADINNNLWVASSTGITVINRDAKIVRTFSLRPDLDLWDIRKSFCLAKNGDMWIGGSEGLYRISAEDVNSITEINPTPVKILSEDRKIAGAILNITEDRINKGLLWIGTETNGLIKITPVSKKFHTNHLDSVTRVPFVFSLLKDHRKNLWIGTTGGLYRYNKSKKKYSVFRRDKNNSNSLPYNFCSHIAETPDKNILLGCAIGLIKIINPESDKPVFKKITVNPLVAEAPVRNIIIYDNIIYIVLPWKIFIYDEKNNSSSEFLSISDSITKKQEGFYINSFVIDKSGNYWVGSSHGLFLFSKKQGEIDKNNPRIFHHLLNDTNSLRSHTINDIILSHDGILWVSTANGLSKAVHENGQYSFVNYSTENGIKNNMVYGALEDPAGKTLWLSTNGGLTKFDPGKNIFTNYDLHDGLQSNEFNGGAYFRADDNEFFFGGVHGYTSFYPHEIVADTQPPSTYITSFKLIDKEFRFDPSSDKKIELKHNDNTFSINFIGLHYTDPKKNSYEYMLSGYQNEWTKSGNTNRVNFTQLPPGEYEFKVKALNNDGIPADKIDSLKIKISPPFRQTIWFYAIIVSLVLIAFWIIHLFRLRMKLDQVKEIEKIRKEIASDFHDELGHKLTTISWFSEILQKKLKPEEKELNAYLGKIKDTSGTLYHTMKDLLWAMDPAKDSVEDLYFQIKEFGESLFDQTGVEFTAGDPPEGLDEKNIPLAFKRHVLLIFKEIMHNSFKHSKGDKVALNVFRENNHVTLSFNDNGKGFETNPETMGYGLRNVEKRTDLINGKLIIESSTTGTNIKLEVPLQN